VRAQRTLRTIRIVKPRNQSANLVHARSGHDSSA